MPGIRDLLEIKKIHERHGIKSLDIPDLRIGNDKYKPSDFEEFRDKKNTLCQHNQLPKFGIEHFVSKHKTAHPDDKCYNGEFIQVDYGYGKILKGIDKIDESHLAPLLEDLKCSNLAFNETFFNIKE